MIDGFNPVAPKSPFYGRCVCALGALHAHYLQKHYHISAVVCENGIKK
jgi:hypothetical protein